MYTFQVPFKYENIDYTTNVIKIPMVNGLPVQFHAVDIKPDLKGAPDVYIFADSPKGFCWGSYPGCTELGGAIMKGITEFCKRNQIEMHS